METRWHRFGVIMAYPTFFRLCKLIFFLSFFPLNSSAESDFTSALSPPYTSTFQQMGVCALHQVLQTNPIHLHNLPGKQHFFFVVETNKSTAQDKALACLLTRISFEWQTKITSLELIAFERSILLLIIIS